MPHSTLSPTELLPNPSTLLPYPALPLANPLFPLLQVEDQEKRLAALLEKDLIQISQFFGVEEARLAQLLGALEQSIREIEQGLGIGEGGGGGGSSSGSRGGATVGMTDRGSRAEADAEEQGGTGAGKGQQVSGGGRGWCRARQAWDALRQPGVARQWQGACCQSLQEQPG